MTTMKQAALALQRDLRLLCDRSAPATAFPDHHDLIAHLGAFGFAPTSVGQLVRLTRDITHLDYRFGSRNPDRMPGHAILYVCKHTQLRLVMRRGVTLESVLAGISNYRYVKTRGRNETRLWDNVLQAVPRGSAQHTDLTNLLSIAHDVFDGAGHLENIITGLESLPRRLSAAEQILLRDLVAAAIA